MLALFLIICLSLDLLGWGIHYVYTRFSCLFLRTLSTILANDCGMNNWMRELDYVKCDSLSQGILFILGLGPYPFPSSNKTQPPPTPRPGRRGLFEGEGAALASVWMPSFLLSSPYPPGGKVVVSASLPRSNSMCCWQRNHPSAWQMLSLGKRGLNEWERQRTPMKPPGGKRDTELAMGIWAARETGGFPTPLPNLAFPPELGWTQDPQEPQTSEASLTCTVFTELGVRLTPDEGLVRGEEESWTVQEMATTNHRKYVLQNHPSQGALQG